MLTGLAFIGISVTKSYSQHQHRFMPVREVPAGGSTVPYKDRIRAEVEQLQTRSSAAFADKQFGAKSRLLAGAGAGARVSSDCGSGSYLCSQISLPVSLISFSGERTGEGTVLLSWETASEMKNAGFEIERSFSTTSQFSRAGFAAPVQSGAGRYIFPDLNNHQGITYYRLKQLDLDGTFSYSQIIAVDGMKGEIVLFAAPNPGRASEISLRLTAGDTGENIHLTVYDMRGIVVGKEQNFKPGPDGRIQLSSLLPSLSPGMYIVKVNSAGTQTAVNLVISR
ncbi:MAG: hypothetical protein ABS46_13095 [Cytophagaceae bacterium SCN 52-12]|nr:MAG: hypothetical protein ABS46_13095 [Cytophagaceae bacterium SCN 52-12]